MARRKAAAFGQDKLIDALVAQPSLDKAAEAAGVGVDRLRDMLEDPAFLRAYRRARRLAYAHGVAMAIKFAPAAVGTLGQIMRDTTAPASARVAAATNLLRVCQSLELEDLAERVDELGGGEEAVR